MCSILPCAALTAARGKRLWRNAPGVGGLRQTERVPDRLPRYDAPWRVEVGRFRAGLTSFLFPMGVHVGLPSAARVSLEVPWPVPEQYDVGLRFDLLDALVDQWQDEHRGEPAFAWLTRPGVAEVHDLDLQWQAATVRGFGAHEVDLKGFRVVTRNGWHDVATGERRVWKRLRL